MAKKTMNSVCPRCRKAITRAGSLYRPFCSERCKLIDLGKWIDEEYRIASEHTLSDEKKEEGREEKK